MSSRQRGVDRPGPIRPHEGPFGGWRVEDTVRGSDQRREVTSVSLHLDGWSPAGIASIIAIVAGALLLVAYAIRRGLVHRELDALEPNPGVDLDPVAASRSRARDGTRTLGLAGAGLLAIGLVLGAVTAGAGWGGGATADGTGGAPDDCAQSWTGCPHATVRP